MNIKAKWISDLIWFHNQAKISNQNDKAHSDKPFKYIVVYDIVLVVLDFVRVLIFLFLEQEHYRRMLY